MSTNQKPARIAGVLYLKIIISDYDFAGFLLPDYDAYEAIFALVMFLPAFISELSMAVWLLVKGVNSPQAELRPSPAV